MIDIIARTIRDRWRMMMAVTLIGVGTMLMYVSLFPTYQDLMKQNTQLFEQMPEALKQAFNMDSFSFDTLEKFLNIEMYSLFWIILTVILTLSLAGSSLAGEVEQETATLTASQPVSRSAQYLGKFTAAIIIFTGYNLIVNFSAIPLAAIFNIPIQTGHFFIVTVMCELFGLAIIGLGFAVSSWLADKGKSHAILAGVILVMYVLNIVSAIQPKIENVKFASLFHYFNPSIFLVKGEYNLAATLVFLSLFLAGGAIGWWRWNRRDII